MTTFSKMKLKQNMNTNKKTAHKSTHKELADLCLNEALVYVKIRSVKVASKPLLKVIILFFG